MCILGGAVEPLVVWVWTAMGTWLVTRPSARNGANNPARPFFGVDVVSSSTLRTRFRGGMLAIAEKFQRPRRRQR